jgi:hypothetical protein
LNLQAALPPSFFVLRIRSEQARPVCSKQKEAVPKVKGTAF